MKISRLILVPLFLIIIGSVFIAACSCNCGNNSDGSNTLKGYITIIGNEPFTKLAIRTDEDKTYVLQVSKELQDELWKKQGSYYYIEYGDLREEKGNSTIVVEKVVPVTKSEK